MTTATIILNGRAIRAELTSPTTVEVDVDGVWAGCGDWDGRSIDNCAAVLFACPDACWAAYEALSDALAGAVS